MSAVIDTPHAHAARPRRTTTTHHGAPHGWHALGLRRPTTRTSARCTCCSRFTMFFVGGMLALVIRAELFQPGLQFVDPSSSTR